MTSWTSKILAAKDRAEINTGYEPTILLVRPELMCELCDEDDNCEEFGVIAVLHGMTVAESPNLEEDFVLGVNAKSIE